MNDIIKTFKFQSENVELLLHIKKGVHQTYAGLKIYIDGELKSKNSEFNVKKSKDGLSVNTNLNFKNKTIFWMSYNPHQGLRWKNYNNKTGVLIFNNVKEMKEKYIIQRDIIPLIGDYFFECIKNAKKNIMLYETPLSDIL